jgi:hypothetical protein
MGRRPGEDVYPRMKRYRPEDEQFESERKELAPLPP